MLDFSLFPPLMPLSTSSFELGLLGYPIGHSLSPKIQAAALRACRLEGNYSLFPVHPDDVQGLKGMLSRLRSGELQGLNVTIPHKQNVIGFLDELSPIARSIGAVNTIYSRGHKLIGENTDAPGFLSDLQRFLTTASRRPGELQALVLGAGGAARAVVYALLKDGWKVSVAARRMERARHLASSFANQQLTVVEMQLSKIELSEISLVVNTTPVGMTPDIDWSPWPRNLPFPSRAAIYDLVYNPRETRLVKDACLQGRSAATGLGMLIEQAALSFEIWTGHRPPRAAMLAALDQSAA